MGLSWSKTNDSSDSDSDSDTESQESDSSSSDSQLSPSSKIQNSDSICTDSATDSIDAALASSSSSLITLNLNHVLQIENQLEEYEKVSMVYLLFDDPREALQELTALLSGSGKKLLYNWAIRQNLHNQKWQEKLVEALCIIQNHQILSEMGFIRADINTRFLPHRMFTCENVNSFRKALYFVCEDLTRAELVHFVRLLSKFKQEQVDSSYLELVLLQWECTGHIKPNNLNRLYTVLKQMEKFDLCDDLKQIVPAAANVKNHTDLVKDKMTDVGCCKKSPEVFDAILKNTSVLDIVSLEKTHISADNGPYVSDDNKYYIDCVKPGVCLIVNQENFYRDVNPDYKHLLPPLDNKLESRLGTEKDRAQLEATFKQFGFRVEVEDNLTHIDILLKIKNVVESVTDESSLFVCIMSHGDKGVVYGVNSCQTSVESIQRVMCSKNRKNLTGKPKVLILQSCQGPQCQKVSLTDDDDENVMDAPSSVTNANVPNTADMFTFWATVPGYGAIRNKKTGSWFIQSLCQQMKVLGNKLHFVDICTAVVNDVTKKKWKQEDGEVAMVPKVDSTLRKFLYLPPFMDQIA